MKLVLWLGLVLVLQFQTTHQQQQVGRVECNGQLTISLQASASKEERRDVGRQGREESYETPASVDEKKRHRSSTEHQEMVELINALSDQVLKMSELLNQTTKKVNIIDEIRPAKSCNTSKVQGRQFLESGDEVYCEDGWRKNITFKVDTIDKMIDEINLASKQSASDGKIVLNPFQVFQKRYDGSVSFERDWSEYKNGFGNLSTEFWMGLDKLHQITAVSTRCRVRFEMWDFSDGHAYAEYSTFSVGDEASSYRLTIAGYSGTAGDSLTNTNPNVNANGARFSTRDRDNDRHGGNCAADDRLDGGGGGSWYVNCGQLRLNNRWSRTSTRSTSMGWYYWKNRQGGIRASKMKVKCD